MSTLPPIVDYEEGDALVVRTDYGDEAAWQIVLKALSEPWGDGEFEPCVHIVDDPAWADASIDSVLAAVTPQLLLSVLFIADHVTMHADQHALLAVTTITREEIGDEEYEVLTEFGREFRTTPVGVHDIYANLYISNLEFESYSAAAQEDPESVYRSF